MGGISSVCLLKEAWHDVGFDQWGRDARAQGLQAHCHGAGGTIPAIRIDIRTSFLTFTVPEMVAYFSERLTLLPGDLIATGVPQPTMNFAAGDTVELTIGHLGTLRNRVVSKPVPGHKKFPPRTVAPVSVR
jgi:2-keto-4-pentenoate hydratase/2-oxohepta-3-ene-1,7-dioic acid hydratase in catechol pathway